MGHYEVWTRSAQLSIHNDFFITARLHYRSCMGAKCTRPCINDHFINDAWAQSPQRSIRSQGPIIVITALMHVPNITRVKARNVRGHTTSQSAIALIALLATFGHIGLVIVIAVLRTDLMSQVPVKLISDVFNQLHMGKRHIKPHSNDCLAGFYFERCMRLESRPQDPVIMIAFLRAYCCKAHRTSLQCSLCLRHSGAQLIGQQCNVIMTYRCNFS